MKMKAIKTLTIFPLLFFFTFLSSVNSQSAKWFLKDIIHGNYTDLSTRSPDKISINANQGFIEFSIKHSQDCTERYRFSYKFSKEWSSKFA